MTNHQTEAKQYVANYVNEKMQTQTVYVTADDFIVKLYVEAFDNWKAIITTIADVGILYDLTHDAIRKATFIDVYHNVDNALVEDDESFEMEYFGEGE